MAKGLVSTAMPGSRWPLPTHGILGIAGDEQHLEVRPQHARRVGHLPPVHAAGQADVGDEQVDAGAACSTFRPDGPSPASSAA